VDPSSSATAAVGVRAEERCPLCGGPSRRRFARRGFWIRDCEACRHRFAELVARDDHVQRTYDDAYFLHGGAGYAGYLNEERGIRARGRWYGRLLARYTTPGTVLDVGCAAGFWLQGLVEAGWKGRGIEPNATMAEHARLRLGLDVETGTLEQLQGSERFDLVSMIQVVAHFTDVQGALRSAAALIRPAGHLLVETWNRESWTARCLGRHWHEYNPPSVLHWFAPESLRRLGERLGLSEIARGRPRKRISGRHAKSLLRHQLGGTPAGRVLARALGVVPDGLPLPYPADDLFWMLLRRSG
jgi:2-polyprenyl-3-methyl-5-hydroxy-6-metoxy-1,4-benzoquinol methylase